MSKEKLLPCPVCGAKPKLMKGESYFGRFKHYFYQCKKCHTSTVCYPDKKSAIRYWNMGNKIELLKEQSNEFKVGDEVWFFLTDIDTGEKIIRHGVLLNKKMQSVKTGWYDMPLLAEKLYKTRQQAEQALEELNKNK
jgi:hypothetical protein